MAKANFAVLDARVYTADAKAPWADALASSRGRILAVGSRREVEPLIGPRTTVLGANGRLILPGFIDPHIHLIWGYELGSWIDLTDRPSLPEVQRRVAAYAKAHPDESILVGHGFDYASLRARGIPGKEDLDVAVSDRPVLLTAWDGHTGLGNTRFVQRAVQVMREVGLDVGEMERDPATSEPTGVFRRTFDLTPLIPEVQGRRSLEGLRQTVAAASAVGITTAFDVQVNLEDLHAYVELRDAGGLTLRVRVAIYHPKGTTAEAYAAFERARKQYHDDSLCVDAVKLYIDGVQETGTAALLEPYANDPTSTGSTVYDVDELRRIVEDLDRRSFQICTHACGDRGVRIALDAYEAAAERNGTRGRRHRIEHCENLSMEDVPRFAELGVIPCMMPRHSSPELTARWREAVGPKRTRSGFPWRELLDSNAALAFASDWPVASMNPLVGIQEAVTRTTFDGDASPHRVSVQEAIDGYTCRAAFACHAESSRGQLSAGMYADLVVLSDDLFEIPPEKIAQARVVASAVGGRMVVSEGTSPG